MSINENIELTILEKSKRLPLNKPMTYKALCALLEQPVYGGDQKKSQLKEFSRYFEFEKVNRKIVIKQVYDKPRDEEHGYPNNTKYAEYIEKILLAYLSTKPGYVTYITSHYLFNVLGMVNKQYIEMQQPSNAKELKEDIRNKLQFDESVQDSSINYYISSFYDRCNNKFNSILNSCFNSFSKQVLINKSIVYSVQFQEYTYGGNIRLAHYYSDQIGDYFTAYLDGKMRETMDEFGYNKEYDIYSRGKKKEFFRVFLEKAQEEYPDLVSAFRCHKILYNQKNAAKKLQKIFDKEKDDANKRELNKRILEYVNAQAQSIYASTTEETDFRKRYSKKYLSAQYYLSNRLININYKKEEDTEETTHHKVEEFVQDTLIKIKESKEKSKDNIKNMENNIVTIGNIELDIGHHPDDPFWM